MSDFEAEYIVRYGSTPVTELHSEFSDRLDGCLAADAFMRVLRGADAQIFGGWRPEFEGCLDPGVISACARLAARIFSLLQTSKDKKIAVAMTGCGTSGRVAYLLVVHLNKVLIAHGHCPCFHYLISGGDSALLFSDELPEDDPIAGAAEVDALISTHGVDGALVIGITCGLSAPYVAGQLDHLMTLMRKPDYSPGLLGVGVMGFNPVFLSRNAPIEKFEDKRSFRKVLRELEQICAAGGRDSFIVNPVIGPEAVAGSSRMKGGSATLALLIACCCAAVDRYLLLDDSQTDEHGMVFEDSIISSLVLSQEAIARTYAASMRALIPAMMAAAGSLTPVSGRRGHVYHIGHGLAGAMACIDTSEMPDTYGSPFDETRAFVVGGWVGLGVPSGDLSHVSSLHRIDTAHFAEEIIPTLTARDTVIVSAISSDTVDETLGDLIALISAAVQAGAAVHALVVTTADVCNFLVQLPKTVPVCVISLLFGRRSKKFQSGAILQAVLSLKVMLNAVSTYAQSVGRGAVFEGRMINTGPSNDKIYQRCVALIGDLVIRKTCGAVLATRQHIQLHEKVHSNLPAFRADVPLQQERLLLCADGSVVVSTTSLIAAAAELCLLKSIYASDRLSDKICSANISDHIKFYLAQVNSPCVVRNDAVSNDIVAVLPVAFLLATSAFDFLLFDEALQREVKVDTISSPRSSWTVQSAAAALKMEPRVSKLLKDILQLK